MGPTETIVVDNASTDGSAEMVRQQFPEVMLIRNPENFGFAKANNIAIRQCNGRYIALVNSDVHALKDCISHLVAHCESHPEVGMVGPRNHWRRRAAAAILQRLSTTVEYAVPSTRP